MRVVVKPPVCPQWQHFDPNVSPSAADRQNFLKHANAAGYLKSGYYRRSNQFDSPVLQKTTSSTQFLVKARWRSDEKNAKINAAHFSLRMTQDE